MKLYATITSERAVKGQGGNRFIIIELKAFDRNNPVATIQMDVMDDADGKPNQYLITYKAEHREDWTILMEGHKDTGIIQELRPQ